MKTYDISYLTPENSCAHSAPPPKKIVAYSATPKKSCAHSGLPPQKMAQNIFNGGWVVPVMVEGGTKWQNTDGQ